MSKNSAYVVGGGAACWVMALVYVLVCAPLSAAQAVSDIEMPANSTPMAQAEDSLQPVAPALPLSGIDSACLQSAYGHNAAALALFDDAVVRESIAQPYPLEPHRPRPKVGEHPGRIRSYALLGALYGHTKEEVQKQLHTVTFMGHSVRLTTAAAAAFTRVAQKLAIVAQEQPQLKAYMLPIGGFTWRTIAGAKRLSPHSYGIAIDLNPAKGPYWLWAAPARRAGESAAARASYPAAIVAAFEAEGFIWGGKWYEYDMMHFEYRPELICKARALQE